MKNDPCQSVHDGLFLVKYCSKMAFCMEIRSYASTSTQYSLLAENKNPA
jgi:hypothetical protein